MLYLEITPRFRQASPQVFTNKHELTLGEISFKHETPQECFDRHRKRCWFKVGDKVRFKKPRRNPIFGIVLNIEEDIEKVTWTKKDSVPNYIHIAVEVTDKSGNTRMQVVKTCENKLLYLGKQ